MCRTTFQPALSSNLISHTTMYFNRNDCVTLCYLEKQFIFTVSRERKKIRKMRSTRRILQNFFDQANKDWDNAWKLGLTPWDLKGTVAPALKQLVEELHIIKPEAYPNILIPGCGSGYECFYLQEKGFKNVIGLDLSSTAIENATNQLKKKDCKKSASKVRFEVADFFIYEPSEPNPTKFDFIFDYLFFAALNHELRNKWAKSMKRLLKNSSATSSSPALLGTLIFPLRRENEDPLQGPPFPVTLEDYEKVLHPEGLVVDRIIQVS
jgi:SAM-dependent methyltransferase